MIAEWLKVKWSFTKPMLQHLCNWRCSSWCNVLAHAEEEGTMVGLANCWSKPHWLNLTRCSFTLARGCCSRKTEEQLKEAGIAYVKFLPFIISLRWRWFDGFVKNFSRWKLMRFCSHDCARCRFNCRSGVTVMEFRAQRGRYCKNVARTSNFAEAMKEAVKCNR
jgi:hypothetical protein